MRQQDTPVRQQHKPPASINPFFSLSFNSAMKPLLILTLLFATAAAAQSPCAKQKQQDSLLLRSFVTTFTTAVLHDDTTALASLFAFPITCTFCPHGAEKEYATVTRKTLFRTQAQYFLTPNLKELLQQDIYSLIGPDGEWKGTCTYALSYPVVKPTATFEGSQAFVTLQKRTGRYLVVSAWMVP
jgi:hypothetical protein